MGQPPPVREFEQLLQGVRRPPEETVRILFRKGLAGLDGPGLQARLQDTQGRVQLIVEHLPVVRVVMKKGLPPLLDGLVASRAQGGQEGLSGEAPGQFHHRLEVPADEQGPAFTELGPETEGPRGLQLGNADHGEVLVLQKPEVGFILRQGIRGAGRFPLHQDPGGGPVPQWQDLHQLRHRGTSGLGRGGHQGQTQPGAGVHHGRRQGQQAAGTGRAATSTWTEVGDMASSLAATVPWRPEGAKKKTSRAFILTKQFLAVRGRPVDPGARHSDQGGPWVGAGGSAW